jgi:hypothetical protein
LPHSRRWHDGRLEVLELGTGRLVLVDPAGVRHIFVVPPARPDR